jgi:hypothetical protein
MHVYIDIYVQEIIRCIMTHLYRVIYIRQKNIKKHRAREPVNKRSLVWKTFVTCTEKKV